MSRGHYFGYLLLHPVDTKYYRVRQLLDEFGGAELCAPTGRAAKRMSEATGRPARTIHRLLEYAGEDGRFVWAEARIDGQNGWVIRTGR